MNLGVFLGIGESLSQMEEYGQKDRFVNQYLKRYLQNFDKVYLFSYSNELVNLPENIVLVPNRLGLHRFLYSLLLPIINYKQVSKCHVIRGFGLTSALSSFILTKPFVFNWAYDYYQFLRLDKKYFRAAILKLVEILAFIRAQSVLIATQQKFKTPIGSKFIYLPNGVDLKAFHNTKSSGRGIIFVGRLERQKNLFFLINAISKLPVKYRSITFIGIGSQERSLKQYAKKKGVALKILKPVNNLQLPSLLSRFSIVTLTSLAEGSPKALLEAMALGLVPVVTSFPTAKEIVINDSNGYVTSYDTSNYARCLESLLSNKVLLKKMSKKAKQTIATHFDLEKLLNQEIQVIKKMAK